MNFRACLELLGLADEDGLTRERVRRVYLRKLREFPPEKDPEGFRRLREAYEYVREVVPEKRAADEVAEWGGAGQQAGADPVVGESKPIVAETKPTIVESKPIVAETKPTIVESKPESVVDAAEDDGYSSLWDPINRVEPPPAGETPAPEPPPSAAPPAAAPLPSAAPPAAAPPTVLHVELPPLARPETDEPPLTLSQLVPTLLRLLEDGSINAAFAIEEDWRERGDLDDVRGASDLLAVRWALVRELMGIAHYVKPQVVIAFARAISAGDVTLARSDLDAFRRSDPAGATQAHQQIVTRAKNLAKAAGNALFTPPPQVYSTYVPPPSRSSGVSGWRVISLCAVVLSAIARLAMNSSTPSYDYHPIDIPKIDPSLYNPSLYNVPTYDPSTGTYVPSTSSPGADLAAYGAPVELPPVPPTPRANADRGALLEEIIVEIQNLSTYQLVDSAYQDKVDVLLGDALDDSCPHMRVSFLRLEGIPSPANTEKSIAYKQQLLGIRERLEIVCPRKKKKSSR